MNRPATPPAWVRRAWQAVAFRRRALLSRLAWPILYPAAWIWRRTWLRRTRLVAVTGSLGKTSTTAAAAAAFGARIDPDAANYGSFLASAILRHRPRRRPLVIEVGISRPGQMRAYARLLRPDVAIVTAIAASHLKSFGTLENLASEKALLPHAVGPRGLVVVNGDDVRCRAIGAAARARVVRVGNAADCDWRIADVAVDWPAGTSFRLEAAGTAADPPAVAAPPPPAFTRRSHLRQLGAPAQPSGAPAPPHPLPPSPGPSPSPSPRTLALTTRWIGHDLARCAALGAAAALAAGFEADGVAARLAAVAPLPWRMQPLPLPGGACLLCDAWQGTWESVQSALRELAGFQGWRRIAVLGDIQEVAPPQIPAYRAYGRLAGAAADRLVFVGSHTNFQRFRAGVRQASPPAPEVERCDDARQAAAALRGELHGRTAILIKGRHGQKLGRVAILLRGDAADCPLQYCPARGLRCELCPRLPGPPGESRKGLNP
jgi:UDP-N-acetylmuramoyl-tripeptide--D-alanyl-D-alanine ligase